MLCALLLSGCNIDQVQVDENSHSDPISTNKQLANTKAGQADSGSCAQYTEQRVALFGDLHVHTSLSFDAAANSTGATPADAHRFARGETIPFWPIGADGLAQGEIQISRPLDFLAVTDHGEFLGERALCRTTGSPTFDTEFCQAYRADQRQGMMMLATAITTETPERVSALCGEHGELCSEFAQSPWRQIQQAANSANEPCEFTSFIAYEYTGTPGTSNYHRNVIFRGKVVPELPVSYIDAPIDSKLWNGLDAVCNAADGCDYLTIPHNTNLANGRMAPYQQLEDTDAAKQSYAKTRLQREPIMEIFQHKGGSECINGLSSVLGAPDELCNVEAVRRMGEVKAFPQRKLVNGRLELTQDSRTTTECAPGTTGANGMLGAGCVHPTDFQRSGLLVGLEQERAIGLNPVKLGTIASTDTHTATPGAVTESTWTGAVTGETSPAERLQPGLLTSGIDGNPGGLAGVWAKENTRDAIFDAMLRREVFGTSGPRITPRLFAGWGLNQNLCNDPERVSKAYAHGVPMGADLSAPPASDQIAAPATLSFLALAGKDPNGLGINALQLIKGWIDSQGQRHNQVLTIAQSAEPNIGSSSLCTVFTDKDFDPAQSAYYYLRAVQPPSPRWHTFDCERLPATERPAVCSNNKYPQTVQEMAWTSPIWFRGS